MKLSNYILICSICILSFVVCGCKQNNNQVVNAKSGIVIHSEDFIKPDTKNVKYDSNVIRLGDGYEKIELDIKPDNTKKM